MPAQDFQAATRRRQQQINKKRRNFFGPQILALLCLLFLFFTLFPLAKNYNRKRVIDQEIEDLKKEISEFDRQNDDLKELLNYLQSDNYVEEQARLSFGQKKDGEEVIVIDNLISDKVSQPEIVDPAPNWQKWLNYFLKP